MSKQTVKLVIEVSEEDAEAILFNDEHGNTQSISDSGSSYSIISAETLRDHASQDEAWVLIANVDGGHWSRQSRMWQRKANLFRVRVLGGDARPEPPPLSGGEEG